MNKKSLKERVEEDIKVCFKICYDNTDENRRVHEAFQEFAKRETDNGYLLAIKQLLMSYSTDWKYETLHQKILQLEQEVALLQGSDDEEEKEPEGVGKTFGRREKNDE